MGKSFSTAGIIIATGQEADTEGVTPPDMHNTLSCIESAVCNLFEGGAYSVIVVLGYRGDEVDTLLKRMRNDRIFAIKNRHYATSGQMVSISIGIRAVQALSCFGKCDNVPDATFIVPDNALSVLPETFAAMSQELRQKKVAALVPHVLGKAAYPVLVGAACYEHLVNARQAHDVHEALQPYADQTLFMDISNAGCPAIVHS